MRLELHSLCKTYKGQIALDSLTLDTGEVKALAVIGPSGGGKSTLLRIIGGLERPDSGTVRLNGLEVEYDEPKLIQYRRGIGTVFQAFNLFSHLNALENITLPLEKVHGYNPSEAERWARELLRHFHLEDHALKKPAELSGGQRQRVAIVRAISIKPRVLLFDEPTSALDPEMSAEVLEVISRLKREGRDIIMVTHEMGFARAAADQAVFLANGAIVEYGPAEQVFSRPSDPITRTFLSRVTRFQAPA
ncbi:MAG: amino acid ABC transporter ATP-binding protein [Deltaproteobacteria bacterium]|nr:amino acid ABC transporter ATP-binding protein [Deltaproteobacteria bacterium]